MLEIVLTVCSVAVVPGQNPACHEERIPLLQEDITLLQCIMNAPRALAEAAEAWKKERPGYRIAGYQCRERPDSEKDS
jgi:hypothetical protein